MVLGFANIFELKGNYTACCDDLNGTLHDDLDGTLRPDVLWITVGYTVNFMDYMGIDRNSSCRSVFMFSRA